MWIVCADVHVCILTLTDVDQSCNTEGDDVDICHRAAFFFHFVH